MFRLVVLPCFDFCTVGLTVSVHVCACMCLLCIAKAIKQSGPNMVG